MNISYNWLKEYIDINWSPTELADRLTMGGLEVEGQEKFETVPGGLEGIVVGEVLTCIPHPNADKLRICEVNIGEDEPSTIVCGAPNVAAGQKVVVATVGSMLYPNEGEPFKIKKAKIRGQLSMGMICAEDELGLGESHDGIIVLPADNIPGTSAAQVYDLETDTILEIGLTPNRVDASSHYGVCRDIAALQGNKAALPEVPAIDAQTENPISIELPEPERCARYVGTFIQGVKVAPSPEWLQLRLRSIGLRPINNIVDITNFVLHELGQPLHAFDADRIRGNKIVVKTLTDDIKFTTLDDTERIIRKGQDLMICDGEGPVAVAGVMGGQNSEVDENTVNVYLESAYFEPSGVRRTASHLSIKTDASYRFERGVDPNITDFAARRATALILELAGGKASAIDDVQRARFAPFEINFDLKAANRLMGFEFTEKEVSDILTSLEIQVQDSGKPGILQLQVPQYRVDVRRPQDVMEEILRIYGYNNVPLPKHNKLALNLTKELDTFALRQKYFDTLAGLGFHEIITCPLVPATAATPQTANLINNLSEDMAVLREEMLQTALDSVEHNHRHKNFDLKMVESGKTYHRGEEGYSEKEWVLLMLTGNTTPANWNTKSKKTTFFTLSQEIDRLQALFGVKGEVQELENSPEFAYGLQLKRGEKVIAKFGQIAPNQLKAREVKGDVYAALIDWEQVIKSYRKHAVKFTPLPKFPSTSRDISMLVPDAVTFAGIQKVVKSANPKLIREVSIMDVYKGDRIEAGKKSYLISLTIQDDNKTLVDKTVDKLMDRVFGKLENDLAVEIRK